MPTRAVFLGWPKATGSPIPAGGRRAAPEAAPPAEVQGEAEGAAGRQRRVLPAAGAGEGGACTVAAVGGLGHVEGAASPPSNVILNT